MCGKIPAESQKEQDEMLIFELCEMVAYIRYEGEMTKAYRILQRRRLRQFHADLATAQAGMRTGSGPGTLKIPRHCERCIVKGRPAVNPLCITNGGCGAK
ncbi:hypothetical protein F4781DRAFT_445485 [Annulohypoxylon bovei var. microspora]|nr:hypothetical protein F4781DRAFT_445485 [Annulohypoxylon bovei var. microspora]